MKHKIQKHMMKALVTRLTDESKLIVTGDVEQIDDPSLNFFNNGLAHLIENGKEEPFIAHITLDIDKKIQNVVNLQHSVQENYN